VGFNNGPSTIPQQCGNFSFLCPLSIYGLIPNTPIPTAFRLLLFVLLTIDNCNPYNTTKLPFLVVSKSYEFPIINHNEQSSVFSVFKIEVIDGLFF